ncbi:hypothetical protein PInf_021921 [Phytophthora infestans]|nr:hypothetical protein PInf_021921 [Phytophthora infestans]
MKRQIKSAECCDDCSIVGKLNQAQYGFTGVKLCGRCQNERCVGFQMPSVELEVTESYETAVATEDKKTMESVGAVKESNIMGSGKATTIKVAVETEENFEMDADVKTVKADALDD